MPGMYVKYYGLCEMMGVRHVDIIYVLKYNTLLWRGRQFYKTPLYVQNIIYDRDQQ